MSLELTTSRLRSMCHLPIFQGFIEVVPHSVPHTAYQPHRESGLTLISLTDLFHSMGHFLERCTVLSVICRHTFVLNIRYYPSPVAPLLRPIIVRLRRTVVHYRYQMLRHSYAPTPCTSGKLADEVGFEPTNNRVKVCCLYRLTTRHQCRGEFPTRLAWIYRHARLLFKDMFIIA